MTNLEHMGLILPFKKRLACNRMVFWYIDMLRKVDAFFIPSLDLIGILKLGQNRAYFVKHILVT
jgi:hypothetical protein